MVVLSFIRYIILLTCIYRTFGSISDTTQVTEKSQDINQPGDRVCKKIDIKKVTESNPKNTDINQAYEENDRYVEDNKKNQVLELKDLICMPNDETNNPKNNITRNIYNHFRATPARNAHYFERKYEHPTEFYNEQFYQNQQARSFNMYTVHSNQVSHLTSNVYTWHIYYPSFQSSSNIRFAEGPKAFVPCIQTDRLLSDNEIVNFLFHRLNSLNYFRNFRDFLPLIEYHYTFKNIKNASAVIFHSRILDNIRINEIQIKGFAKTTDEERLRIWSLFSKKYSKIKIIDFDSPLISFFPGIIMLKDFIYKLLTEKRLKERNIFNIFVGMKIIESLLFSSKEMIAGLSKENSLDIFSYGHGATNIIIAHKRIFFTILKKILFKNFNLSKKFIISLRITEMGCVYLSNDKLYLNKANKYHFLRALIDSIYFLDDMLMNTVSNIYEKSIIDVDLQTGYVAHIFFDFSELENFEIDPDLSLKFIKYYLILLQNEEFISSGNINKIVFKNVIENLAIEVDNVEKELTNSCSIQPKEHINLLFKCLSIFNFIIKCEYNINLHNSLYLERIS
ncbi:hypothetical protein CWI37_0092p0010 [Hamiltosporidium tvaerminnensis]|uniref:Uncharacterized protein n=1 Tax=Hamiltosporidium tvaerminnensis TaxID=1176355 RepID=A0A4Q9LAE7_9MICR|nr:hypothetical protein LUQ84_002675 [Hamiltosporidium tvaerminnensis]TBU04749.1 hypothetical protein CWI37_0092p0010 [Hamiltosporidium tvaerminnensis]